VKELKLSPDGNLIQQIRVARQVDLKDGKETDEYQPLIPVHGLPCWPNRPDQDQIVQDLKQTPEHPEGVDLESHWAEWTDAAEHTLVAGEHFDQVILGISLAALPFLCPELKEKSSAWRDMLRHLKTVKTQSVQLWFQPTDNELGWPVEGGIVGSFAEPYASWADFDQLQGRESWTGFLPQNSVFYCCNVLKDGEHPLPPPTEHDFPKQQLAEATEEAMEVLRQDSGYLWPQGAGSSGQLEWALLTAPEDLKGERRARDFQYFRANVDPTERYVLSIAQPKQYRLKSGESGFDNLFLTGTWTDNGFNLSSVEAAVMSGMQASRALSGVPIRIVGENDFLD
jgi:uncharacterized protein with NAD-binding domain and iron-sulfur cluster